MKTFFSSFTASSSSGTAAQPVVISALVGSSAEQAARETAVASRRSVEQPTRYEWRRLLPHEEFRYDYYEDYEKEKHLQFS